jgi:hypothetical protein
VWLLSEQIRQTNRTERKQVEVLFSFKCLIVEFKIQRMMLANLVFRFTKAKD